MSCGKDENKQKEACIKNRIWHRYWSLFTHCLCYANVCQCRLMTLFNLCHLLIDIWGDHWLYTPNRIDFKLNKVNLFPDYLPVDLGHEFSVTRLGDFWKFFINKIPYKSSPKRLATFGNRSIYLKLLCILFRQL